MNCSEIDILPDCERVFVHGATVSMLASFLDLTVAWVWILGQRPSESVQWWTTAVPLNLNSTFTGMVRNVVFDMQLPTSDFLHRATDFDRFGLSLIQSHRQMPDTLCLEQIPEPQQRRILVQNGATLRIFLPHAVETALVESYTSGHLAQVIGT